MKKSVFLCLVMFAVFSLGCKHKEMGENEKALEELNKEFKAFQDANGQGDSAFAFVDKYIDLASKFEKDSDLYKAIECEKVILEIYAQTWDKPMPKTAFRLWSIGYKYRLLNEYDSAVTYLQNAIEITDNLKKNDETTDSVHERLLASCYQDLALIYSDKGENQKAIESLEAVFKYQPIQVKFDKEIVAHYSDLLASLYCKEANYASAIKYFEKALCFYQEVKPDSVFLIDSVREGLLDAKYMMAIKEGQIDDYLTKYIFVISCDEGDSPARQQGMTGEYVLLEFANWNLNSKTSLYDVNKETTNKPIDIVIMRDNKVEKHHFEDKVGILFHLREVGKEERDRINTIYKRWKTNL